MADELPPPTPIRPPDTSNDAEFSGFISFEGRKEECPVCDGREFVLGFEVGLLQARLEAKPPTWRGTYHADNRMMLERVAQAYGYSTEITPSGDPTWLFISFARSAPVRRLTVVPREGP